MIYKTVESQHAVWVSEEPSWEQVKLNFVAKKGGSKFENDFQIKKRFIDYDHAISLWLPNGDCSGFGSVIDTVKAECQKVLPDGKITYIFALDEFEYNGNVQKNETLIFLGNINLQLNIRDWAAERQERGY